MCPVENAHFAFARVPMPVRTFLFNYFSVGDLLVLLQGLCARVFWQFLFLRMPVVIESFDLRVAPMVLHDAYSVTVFAKHVHSTSFLSSSAFR